MLPLGLVNLVMAAVLVEYGSQLAQSLDVSPTMAMAPLAGRGAGALSRSRLGPLQTIIAHDW